MNPELLPYKLWFEYVRRSIPANWTQEVVDVFGDVWASDFDDWWEVRSKYFLPPEPVPLVVIEDLADYMRWEPGAFDELKEVVVMCNLDVPKRTLMQAFEKLLDELHERKMGRPVFNDWGDLFKLDARPDTHALQVRLDVFDARAEGLSYVKIADTLNLIDRKTVLWKLDTPKDLAAQKAVKQSTVSRYLKEAEALIRNVEAGVFPKSK